MKKRTTIYLDDEVLRAAKIQAAREGRHDYEVVEAALRRYLGFDVVDRVRERNFAVSESDIASEIRAALAETRAERRPA